MFRWVLTALAACVAATDPWAEAPLKVVFVSGSFEYHSDDSLALYKSILEERYNAEVTMVSADGWYNLPGLEALESCDTALFFTRRLQIDGAQLNRIKAYCMGGKPLVAVRTASHGFQNWLDFDNLVLGGSYDGHYDNGPTTEFRLYGDDARNHPILEGVESFRSRESLYKNPTLDEHTTVLAHGVTPEHREPVAWTHERGPQRVFYTSLGGTGDFENAAFQRMLSNALFWTAEREVERRPLPPLAQRPKPEGTITVPVRKRFTDEDGACQTVTEPRTFPIAKTAILICDMWDKHWCSHATERCGALAERMNPVLVAARAKGVLIIHSPSSCMGFYVDAPQRRRAQAAPPVEPALVNDIPDRPLPIDAADEGCPTNEHTYGAWTREDRRLSMGEFDVVSDDGHEVYNVLEQEGIEHIVYMGVHTNMCVLGRPFAIRQMTRWGKNCYLVRDLTDTMYDPADWPYVTHDRGTELVVEHIERYWAPSLVSGDLMGALSTSEETTAP